MDKTSNYIIDEFCRVIGVIPPDLMKHLNIGEMGETKDGQRYYVTEEQLVVFLEMMGIKAH
jgi:hypothetical protein